MLYETLIKNRIDLLNKEVINLTRRMGNYTSRPMLYELTVKRIEKIRQVDLLVSILQEFNQANQV